MRMKMGNKILWLMSCLLFCGQVVWGEGKAVGYIVGCRQTQPFTPGSRTVAE